MIPNVLETISESVRVRLEMRKRSLSLSDLMQKSKAVRKPFAFARAFQSHAEVSILAEIKFKSPAVGELKLGSKEDAVSIASEYLAGGANALSVLTEVDHFSGNPEYLTAVRNAFPDSKILMKDFIVDEYQIYEARLIGADCILLIIALLGEVRTREFVKIAKDLGLSTLIEVHDESELEIAERLDCDLIGVNNRNLKTLSVSIETSVKLAKYLPKNKIILSESGISSHAEITRLKSLGYQGFLIGSSIMQSDNPKGTIRALKGLSP